MPRNLINLDLTPNGKTLITFYPSSAQGKLIARSLDIFGQPEWMCAGETDPDIVHILFPHQDMPEELYEVAEEMTTKSLLHYLGFDKQGGEK
jgi:hypothetical protein